MRAFFDLCERPERDDDDPFEVNDSFGEAVALDGFLSQKGLKRLPGNDDYFRWTANAFSNATFSISFSHAVGDLALDVYDSSQILMSSSQSLRDGEDVFVAGVEPGQQLYVRVFGQNDISVPYVLTIASDGDRDHDGVIDSKDSQPDDPNVSARDSVAPVLTAPLNLTVAAASVSGTASTDPALAAFLSGAAALDAVDGVITPVINDAPLLFPLGITTVTFSATDNSGNTGQALATVTVLDQAASSAAGGGLIDPWMLLLMLGIYLNSNFSRKLQHK